MDTIDLLQLPSVPFLDERPEAQAYAYKTMQLAVPNESGVYIVVTDDNEVIYIGQSTHIKERWKNHQLLPALRSPGKTIRIAYWLCPVGELDACEAALLKAYRPRLNTPWEIEKATDSAKAKLPCVSWAETACLGKDQSYAKRQLKEYGPCGVNPIHTPQSIVICTACLENVWCADCIPSDWRCDCWKIRWDRDDNWPWISMEAYDALHLGIDLWLKAHPGDSTRTLEHLCRSLGGNRIRFAAFSVGHHYPSQYEAEIFSQALGTTLDRLEEGRMNQLSISQ